MTTYALDDGMETPSVMGKEEYAQQFSRYYDAYITYKVHGIHSHIAIRRAFGEGFWDADSVQRCHHIERTEYYKAGFQQKLKETPVEDLWNEKKAINELLQRANDPYDKGSTKLRAVQELNVLIGITIVDENGRTRKGSSMADFYATQTKPEEAQQ